MTHPLLTAPLFTLDEAEKFLNAAREEGLWYRDRSSDVEGGLGYVVITPADEGLRWHCPLHIATSVVLDTVAVARIIQDSIKHAVKIRAQALEAP